MGLIQFYNKQCAHILKIESFDAPDVWKLFDPNLIYIYHNKSTPTIDASAIDEIIFHAEGIVVFGLL